MNDYLENTSIASEEIDDKPAHLCKKCGICCRVVVPSFSLEEIEEMARNNEKEAIDFLRIFVPYDSPDEIPEYGRPHYNQIIATMSDDENFDAKNVTVFHCKYVNDEQLCPIYSERPDCCRRAPHTGWSLFAPSCGYAGWQFLQREKQKQRVRKLKEILYEIEMIGDPNRKYKDMTIEELKEYVNEKIKPYEKYGAKSW